MITVHYEEYENDYRRKNLRKTFRDLAELEEWIFGQMQTPYADKERGWLYMYFPDGTPGEVKFVPERPGPIYWIHQISDNRGILFTDGKYTSWQKHISQEVKDWFDRCRKRQYQPKFQFVD